APPPRSSPPPRSAPRTTTRPRACTGPTRTEAASSIESGEALGDVGEVRRGGVEAGEQLARLRRIARPFVEVGERVPEAEVVSLGLLDLHRTLLEQANGVGDLTPVSERAGGDDAALGDDLPGGVGLAQLAPELVCLPVT